jgi:RNA-directed DNA polymerase
LIFNVAMAALDEQLHRPWKPGGTMATSSQRARRRAKGLPNWRVVRYADDFVVLVHGTRADVETLHEEIAQVLAPLGLRLSGAKTRIVHMSEAFDFLGFRIQWRRKYGSDKWYVYTFIADRPIRSLKAKIRALTNRTSQQDLRSVLIRLNQIMRGGPPTTGSGCPRRSSPAWTTTCGGSPTGGRCERTRTNRKRWVTARYFGSFHPSRRDRWVFGDRDSGRYLVKFSWTPIVRHRLVTGGASPDDPALASYWSTRRRRGKPPLGPFLLRLLQSQKGRCPGCGSLLLHADREPQSPDEWEQWLKGLRKAIRRTAVIAPGRPPDENARCLMHTSCARHQNNARAARLPQLPPEPSGLA